jgi:drug/metabolite transporter (DMT)-like permease
MALVTSNRIALFFVFLWSSSFIALKLSSAHIEPATLVVFRTGITAIIYYLIVIYQGANWPKHWIDFAPSIVVGVLMHGVYGCGVILSIDQGVNLTLCVLILSLQPILTTLLSAIFLGEKLTLKMALGIVTGFLGVSIVIFEKGNMSAQLALAESGNIQAGNETIAIMMCFLALLAISGGTIIQKRYCSDIEPMPGAFVQFSSAMYFIIPFALMFETMHINWVLELTLSLGWLIMVVSISAMTLLMSLIKNDKASVVSSLFYLVTPLVAIQSWFVYGEKLSLLSIGGMLICLSGVFMVSFCSDSTPTRHSGSSEKQNYFDTTASAHKT